MKHTSGTMGFWEPGARIYGRALADAAAEQLAKLRRRLEAAATPAEKQQIEEQIAAAQTEFKKKCNDALHSLF